MVSIDYIWRTKFLTFEQKVQTSVVIYKILTLDNVSDKLNQADLGQTGLI